MQATSDQPAEVRLGYDFTPERYARAAALYARCRIKPGLRWMIHALALGLIAFVAAALILHPNDPLLWAMLPVGPVLLFRQSLNRWVWTRQFRRSKLCGQRVEVVVTADGVATAIPGRSSGRQEWSLLDAVATRDRDILLLQNNRRIFHYLPGDAYLCGSVEQVLALAEGRVPVVAIP